MTNPPRFLSTDDVLALHGIAIADQAEPVILQLAAGALDKNAFTDWARKHMREKPRMELRVFFAALNPTSVHEMAGRVIASGREDEAQATIDEAVKAIPVAQPYLDAAQRAKDAGRTDAYNSYNSMAVLLTALYRIAEDMGYEW